MSIDLESMTEMRIEPQEIAWLLSMRDLSKASLFSTEPSPETVSIISSRV